MKLHKESMEKLLSGSLGKVFPRGFIEHQFYVMEKTGTGTMDITAHFFDKNTMGAEEGDVSLSVTLTLKKIAAHVLRKPADPAIGLKEV
jgi:hypothetical protein